MSQKMDISIWSRGVAVAHIVLNEQQPFAALGAFALFVKERLGLPNSSNL